MQDITKPAPRLVNNPISSEEFYGDLCRTARVYGFKVSLTEEGTILVTRFDGMHEFMSNMELYGFFNGYKLGVEVTL